MESVSLEIRGLFCSDINKLRGSQCGAEGGYTTVMAFIEYPHVWFPHAAGTVVAGGIQKALWALARHRRRTRG